MELASFQVAEVKIGGKSRSLRLATKDVLDYVALLVLLAAPATGKKGACWREKSGVP